MTHDQAIRTAATMYQRMGKRYREDASSQRDEGGVLEAMFTEWAAEQYALARALLRIECDEVQP